MKDQISHSVNKRIKFENYLSNRFSFEEDSISEESDCDLFPESALTTNVKIRLLFSINMANAFIFNIMRLKFRFIYCWGLELKFLTSL